MTLLDVKQPTRTTALSLQDITRGWGIWWKNPPAHFPKVVLPLNANRLDKGVCADHVVNDPATDLKGARDCLRTESIPTSPAKKDIFFAREGHGWVDFARENPRQRQKGHLRMSRSKELEASLLDVE